MPSSSSEAKPSFGSIFGTHVAITGEGSSTLRLCSKSKRFGILCFTLVLAWVSFFHQSSSLRRHSNLALGTMVPTNAVTAYAIDLEECKTLVDLNQQEGSLFFKLKFPCIH